MDKRLVKIGEAAALLGTSIATLRRWEDISELLPARKPARSATDGKRIKLPVIGWIRMRVQVRISGTSKRVTISRTADRWFASILVETDDMASVGVDLGVKTLATLSPSL